MLPEDTIRAMIALLGEVAANQGTHAEKKKLLMDGICKLIDADAWVWALGKHEPGKEQAYAGILNGGFEDHRFAKFLLAIEHSDSIKATIPYYEHAWKTRKQVTMDDEDMDPKQFAYQGELGKLWTATGYGPTILSAFYIDDEASISTTGFYRNAAKPKFGVREKKIVNLLLSEVRWLHYQGWPRDRGVKVPTLSRQQRNVLNLLLKGLPRKQIAAHLGIRQYTVDDYVQAVFQHFSVHSHPELIAKFSVF